MESLDRFAADKLAALERRAQRRRLQLTDRYAPARARRNGRDLISLCCNDYLDLSHHPDVIEAAVAALRRYGAGSGASRLVTGNHPLFAELEARLARIKGTAAACVFGSGYLANVGIIPTFAGERDLIVADELCHACLFSGSRLSGAALHVFRHNDLAHCAQILAHERGRHPRCLILTDGVFSMDGDLAPVAELAELAERHDAWLLTDDAHGIGVVGGGRGSSFAAGRKLPIALQMGTLSKAVGGYGGYLCASEPVIDFVKTRARSLIYSTGLPPATVGAAIAALHLIETDTQLIERPLRNARRFTRLLNLPEPQSCIVPIILGDETRTLEASARLEQAGFLVTAIRPPTVPAGTARLRFTFTAGHEDAQIDDLAAAVRALLADGP